MRYGVCIINIASRDLREGQVLYFKCPDEALKAGMYIESNYEDKLCRVFEDAGSGKAWTVFKSDIFDRYMNRVNYNTIAIKSKASYIEFRR